MTDSNLNLTSKEQSINVHNICIAFKYDQRGVEQGKANLGIWFYSFNEPNPPKIRREKNVGGEPKPTSPCPLLPSPPSTVAIQTHNKCSILLRLFVKSQINEPTETSCSVF